MDISLIEEEREASGQEKIGRNGNTETHHGEKRVV